MKHSTFQQWGVALVGSDQKRRKRVQHALTGFAFLAVLSAVVGVTALLGLTGWVVALAAAAVFLGWGVMSVLLMRSELGGQPIVERYAGWVQGVACIVALCVAYAAAGPARGAVLLALPALWLMSPFGLSQLQMRRLCLVAMVALALTCIAGALAWPARQPLPQETLNFVLASAAMLLSCLVAGRLSELRDAATLLKSQLDEARAQTRLLVTQDELTGLSNQRHMMSLIVTERARQQRHREPISVVMLDIDFFQRINERWGQSAGDQVLQIFADVISHGMRAGDALSRWGGEEFLLMLPETPADSALVCIERIRRNLISRSFEHIGRDIQVTFSAGISECTVGDRMELAIDRADRAMNKAKTQGRNRSALA